MNTATVSVPTSEYVKKKIDLFRDFFRREIEILESPVVVAGIAHEMLTSTVRRITLVIDVLVTHNMALTAQSTGIPHVKLEKLRREWTECLTGFAEILDQQAEKYQPDDGSFWEDVQSELKTLAITARAAS